MNKQVKSLLERFDLLHVRLPKARSSTPTTGAGVATYYDSSRHGELPKDSIFHGRRSWDGRIQLLWPFTIYSVSNCGMTGIAINEGGRTADLFRDFPPKLLKDRTTLARLSTQSCSFDAYMVLLTVLSTKREWSDSTKLMVEVLGDTYYFAPLEPSNNPTLFVGVKKFAPKSRYTGCVSRGELEDAIDAMLTDRA